MKVFRGDKTKRTPQPKNEGWVAPSFDVVTRVLVFVFFLSTRFGTEEVSPHSGETPSRSCFGGCFSTPKRG